MRGPNQRGWSRFAVVRAAVLGASLALAAAAAEADRTANVGHSWNRQRPSGTSKAFVVLPHSAIEHVNGGSIK